MNPLQSKLIRFLQADLDLSDAAIATALRQLNGQLPHLLPMVLWQYGLVTLDQLDSIFDWLETA
ncbi:MAG: DUF2949 domain-containing protein [Synechococcales cyanobacterium K44_A2020_017]|nr:DUF2949 domain-containing protein [Synechococcales cyanobacterium K32_A2020_035]MBF2093669.1 DUF2949 domain-containing protein [Synechococcales cyanobacterium K44_A2020_017]